MALKLDNNLLDQLGVGQLPEAEKQLLLRQIYEKLEMNVGMRLADQMSNEQLDAFEKFVDANDDKGAFQWLETNFPNYKLVVNEEFEKLKAEIISVAPQILASAQQQASAGAGADASAGAAGVNPQQPAQPQQQPAQHQPQQQPSQPQPQYQSPQPQPQQYTPPMTPTPAQTPANGAMPQSGHLQPQYGVPTDQPQPAQQQPQYGQQQYPPQQPPAGPAQ